MKGHRHDNASKAPAQLRRWCGTSKQFDLVKDLYR